MLSPPNSLEVQLRGQVLRGYGNAAHGPPAHRVGEQLTRKCDVGWVCGGNVRP